MQNKHLNTHNKNIVNIKFDFKSYDTQSTKLAKYLVLPKKSIKAKSILHQEKKTYSTSQHTTNQGDCEVRNLETNDQSLFFEKRLFQNKQTTNSNK